jgi:hypothetical protein
VLSRTPPSFSSIVRATEDDSFVGSLEHENLIETSLVTYPKPCSRKAHPAILDASADHPRKPVQNPAVQFLSRYRIGPEQMAIGEQKTKLAL